MTVATKSVDYASPAVQAELLAFRARIAQMAEAVQPLPPFWLHYLLAYANATGVLGADGLLPADAFYPTLREWRSVDGLSYAQSQGNFGYGARGELVYAEMPLFVHGVQEPTQCIAFVGALQGLCDEATGDGLPAYALGLPFYRCERYVHLRFWCARGVGIALAVVFCVSVGFMGAVREALLMTISLFANLAQLAGLLAFLGMKINGALVMATVASIGCASEYAGHFTMAFLQARGTAPERIAFAFDRSLHPLFDSACSTVLGVVMIAFAAFPFVVRYFFVPMVLLTLLNFANAVLLLPCLLLLLGSPCPADDALGSDDLHHCTSDVETPCEPRAQPPPPPPPPPPPMPSRSRSPVSPRTPDAPTPPPPYNPAYASGAEPVWAVGPDGTLVADAAQPPTPATPEPPREWADERELAWEPSPAPPPTQPHAARDAPASGAKERTVLFSGFDLSDELWGERQGQGQML